MTYSKQHYQLQTQFGGWTRIDMLLAIYDKAIVSIKSLQAAQLEGDSLAVATRLLESQKCILAIHSGLKPDEHDVAYNIARLLNFVLLQLEEKKYDEAIRFLDKLRDGFAQIYDEAIQLEAQGKIPPFHMDSGVSSLA